MLKQALINPTSHGYILDYEAKIIKEKLTFLISYVVKLTSEVVMF